MIRSHFDALWCLTSYDMRTVVFSYTQLDWRGIQTRTSAINNFWGIAAYANTRGIIHLSATAYLKLINRTPVFWKTRVWWSRVFRRIVFLISELSESSGELSFSFAALFRPAEDLDYGRKKWRTIFLITRSCDNSKAHFSFQPSRSISGGVKSMKMAAVL
jgi:hypothetical protein